MTTQLPMGSADPEPIVAGVPKRTEHDMLTLLRDRHTKPGNGGAGEWAFLTHVRDAAGFDARRTIDAMALSLWPSRGHELHGFEVKVSRSDWLRELADPAKSDGFIARCDRWWLVAAEGVAKPGEMPEGWGLLIAQGNKLRAAVQAPKLSRTPEQRLVDRGWLVCLLRSAGAVLASRPEDVEAARAEGFESGRASALRGNQQWERVANDRAEEARVLREQIREFERTAGFTLSEYGDKTGGRAARAGTLVKAALDGDRAVAAQQDRLKRMAEELERSADHLREIAGPRSAPVTAPTEVAS